MAYWAPRVTSLTVNRCSSTGDLDDYGTYAKVVAVWECCQLLGANNAKTITFQYSLSPAITWTTGTTKSLSSTSGETSAVIGDGQILTDDAYGIRVTISDNKGGSTTRYANIPAATFLIDFLAGGKGVAFGKPASKENAVEFNFDVYDKNGNRLVSALDCYPVGSIYIAYNNTSPASLFGGSWTRITSRFLYAGTASSTMGATGGSSTVALTADQMPKHNHEGIYYSALTAKNLITLNSGSVSYHVPWGSSDYAGDCGAGTGTTELKTGNTGGGGAHNNMPPYITVSIWRRTA